MSEELLYFNEDAVEQLQMMESALLDIQEQGVSKEHIGTIFRAMHTIKGVAGMFDFRDIIAFTHVAENLMDAIRSDKIAWSEAHLGLFLECKDHVALLVESAVHESALSEEVLKQDRRLKTEIETFLNGEMQTHSALTESPKSTGTSASALPLWEMELHLKETFFETGMDLLSILAYLGKLGTIQQTQIDTEKLAFLDAIDPYVPGVSFTISFESQASETEIREVFEFVEDDIVLTLTQKAAADTLEIEGFEMMEDEAPTPLAEALEQPQREAPAPQETKAAQDSQVQQLQKPSQSLRVDSQKIDLLIDTISEMVTLNIKMAQHVEHTQDTQLEDLSLELSSLLQTLRNNVMQIRLLSVGDSFEKLRRVVRDVANKLGKKINFTITGGETELDKTVIEKIADPLVHMLRNAVDHGIEMPEVRQAAGKTESGNIALRAYPDSGSIVIEIEDDGKGLSPAFLIEKAVQKGLISADAKLSDAEAYQLIFAAGFSTAAVVSDISGRGVGMDVVKKNIEALKGDVVLTSREGFGSCFTIRLPLTLAIIDGFLFQVGESYFIIPLDMIVEVVEYKEELVSQDGGVFALRDLLIPLLDMQAFYEQTQTQEQSKTNIIVVKYAGAMIGLVVGELFGENQTVIKPLGRLFKEAPAIYGASLLGSGEIALIMDIPALFNLTRSRR